jgi:hypothetical protein
MQIEHGLKTPPADRPLVEPCSSVDSTPLAPQRFDLAPPPRVLFLDPPPLPLLTLPLLGLVLPVDRGLGPARRRNSLGHFHRLRSPEREPA